MTMNQPVPSARDALKLAHPMSVAIYDEYADAAHAVDYLADRQFPVANLAIVGTDLKSIEKVTGNLSWGRVLLSGFLQGFMWAGMFAIFMWMFVPGMSLVNALLIGMLGFGIVGMAMAALQYRMRGGERDYTSSTQIIATHYEVLAEAEHADRARHLLSGGEPGGTRDRRHADESSNTAADQPRALGSFPPPFGQQPYPDDQQTPTQGVDRPVPGNPSQPAPAPWGGIDAGSSTSPQQPYGIQQPYGSQQPSGASPAAASQDSGSEHAAQSPYGQYWGADEPPGIGDVPQRFQPTEAASSASGDEQSDRDDEQGGSPTSPRQ